MYKIIVTYPYANGRRVKNIYYATTKFMANIIAWLGIHFCNDDFFKATIEQID